MLTSNSIGIRCKHQIACALCNPFSTKHYRKPQYIEAYFNSCLLRQLFKESSWLDLETEPSGKLRSSPSWIVLILCQQHSTNDLYRYTEQGEVVMWLDVCISAANIQDNIDCDSLFASWRITDGWISQNISRWLHIVQNTITFDFEMQFVLMFLWDWPDAPKKKDNNNNKPVPSCACPLQSFQCSSKVPRPALNDLWEITVTTETKNENVSHDHFFLSQNIRFSKNVITCMSSYLLIIDYRIVLYIFIVFWRLSVRGCWVIVSSVSQHTCTNAYVKCALSW